MPEQLWLTAILNHLFAGPVTAFLRMLHLEPKYPAAPISNAFAMELLVFLFLIVVFLLVRSRLSVESPGALQHTFEGIEGFAFSQSHEIIGHHVEPFIPFFVIIFIFILVCNLIGLIPGFDSPTGVPVVPLGCAICSFIYYHTQGFKHAGPKYLLHFFGPPMEGMPLIARIFLAALMLPIELVSHFARLLSLTVRLWANIFAGDLITLVFFSMIPIGVPIIFSGLHIVVAVLQAYVFMLLSIIYVSGAVAEEHLPLGFWQFSVVGSCRDFSELPFSVRASARYGVNHPLGGNSSRSNTMRYLSRIFMTLSALCFALPAFAQGGTAGETNWVAITAGFSMAIASAVCGLAQGKAVASATESLARNPAARPGIQFALILGLVLIESLALYTLAIIFLKVK